MTWMVNTFNVVVVLQGHKQTSVTFEDISRMHWCGVNGILSLLYDQKGFVNSAAGGGGGLTKRTMLFLEPQTMARAAMTLTFCLPSARDKKDPNTFALPLLPRVIQQLNTKLTSTGLPRHQSLHIHMHACMWGATGFQKQSTCVKCNTFAN